MVAVEGFYFEPVTAACVRAFMAAARAAGHAISITQGYRALGKPTDPWSTSPVTQWSAWNAMKQGHPLPGASTVATAAPPGTSTHGDGMSADYTGTGWHPETALSKWAETHAIIYGIVFDIPSESWHGHRKFAPQISVASSGAAPIKPSAGEAEEEEEDTVPNSGFIYPRKSDGATMLLVVNTQSGFVSEYSGSAASTYNNGVASAYQTASWPTITESHADAIKASCAEVRATE